MAEDLTRARQYADPWGGVDEEIAPERVKQWGRETLERPISVGLPGMYFTPGQDEQGRRRIFKTEEAPKGAATFDPMMGLITESQALGAVRGIMRNRFSKWSPKNWGKSALAMKETRAIEQLDMEDLVKKMPEGLWARIKAFGRTARHPTAGKKYAGLHTTPAGKGRADIWVDPHGMDPAGSMTHEVGHEASDAFLEWSRKQFLGKFNPNAPAGQRFAKVRPGAFAKLRKEWGEISADMRYLRDSQPGVSKLSKSRLYDLNPDEIFANRFTDALNEGMDFRESVKIAAHEVKANLSASRDLVTRINKEVLDRTRIAGIAY